MIETPHGPTQVEIRMMYVWTDRLRPVLPLVRMGRGKMMGVDHNKGCGGSARRQRLRLAPICHAAALPATASSMTFRDCLWLDDHTLSATVIQEAGPVAGSARRSGERRSLPLKSRKGGQRAQLRARGTRPPALQSPIAFSVPFPFAVLRSAGRLE